MSERSNRLFIGGLAPNVTKTDLRQELSGFGTVANVWVARNPPGFAFADFVKASDAEKAIRALDGFTVCNSKLRVEFALTRQRQGENGRQSFNVPRNDRSPPPRPYNSPPPPPRRGRSPPAILVPSDLSRHPYDPLAALCNPDMLNVAAAAATGFPFQIPDYQAMFPFLPNEDILRSLQIPRRNTPPARGRSPSYRRRSRSPIGNRHRNTGSLSHMEDHDRYRDNRHHRGRSPPRRYSPPLSPAYNRRPDRISDTLGRRQEYDRSAPRNGDRRRR